MTKQMNYWIMSALVAMICFTSCSSNKDSKEMQRVYDLNPVDDQSFKGKVTFLKLDENSTQITVELQGTTSGNSHLTHIHANSVNEGGGVVVPLTNVDGATGRSVTTVTEMKGGTAVTYEDLLVYDGHINVHHHEDPSIFIAQGNIGSNSTE